jgi:SMC interacting uncharacterized protein involved in chromosome segregation
MRRIILTTIAISAALVGCKSTYYKAAETVGYEKREMLTDRMQDARDSQVAAKQQLQTALYTLRRVGSVPETEVADLHHDLDTEVDRASEQLDDLHEDIASVESVAQAMFDDWEDDLAKYESEDLRARSRQELQETRQNYSALIGSLRETEQKLQTVIAPLKDQVMAIEHAMKAGQAPEKSDDLDDVREKISTLIEELDDSIDRTQRFIDESVEVSA